MPLYRETDKAADEACAACDRRFSKPGYEPPGLGEAIAAAYELDEEKQLGRVFSLDEISPREWAALRGLHRGRAEADEKERQRKEKEQKTGQGAGEGQARLLQMLGRQ